MRVLPRASRRNRTFACQRARSQTPGRLIRGLLIDVSPWDPLTLLAVASGLTLVAMTACYVPARRVLGIDPAPVLRAE